MDPSDTSHAELQEIVSLIKSCIAVKKGLRLSQLPKQYKDFVGKDISYKKFGFECLDELLFNITDVIINYDRDPEDPMLYVEDRKVQHMQELMERARSRKKKVKKQGLVTSRAVSTEPGQGTYRQLQPMTCSPVAENPHYIRSCLKKSRSFSNVHVIEQAESGEYDNTRTGFEFAPENRRDMMRSKSQERVPWSVYPVPYYPAGVRFPDEAPRRTRSLVSLANDAQPDSVPPVPVARGLGGSSMDSGMFPTRPYFECPSYISAGPYAMPYNRGSTSVPSPRMEHMCSIRPAYFTNMTPVYPVTGRNIMYYQPVYMIHPPHTTMSQPPNFEDMQI